jgi:DNA polymerase-3 subunit delta
MNRIKIFNNSLSKSDFARAAEFFHMSNQRKTTFNLFSQNIWFVSKLASACMKFDLSELLRFQSAFSSAFTAITERAHEQKSVLKELAVACLCRR